MKYAILFDVLEGGDIEPLKWSKEVFKPNKSIILLEEMTPAVWLWHGEKQPLIARRVASRQAEALKGYGYISGGTIIGSRTRIMNEIDVRKLGKDPNTDNLNVEFQKILTMEFNPLDEFIVTFPGELSEIKRLELRTKTVISQNIENQSVEKDESLKETAQEKQVQHITEPTKLEEIQDLSEQKQRKIQPDMTKKPIKPIKKTEFSFESSVKEIPETSLEINEEQIATISKALNSSNIIQDLVIRIDKLEQKLDILIENFIKFEKKHIKNEKT